MICQATYDSLEAIPEDLREEFHQVKGKWVLKETAIPGVGPLFNPGLAANEERAVSQVKARNERITKLEEENNLLKDKLSALDSPDSRVLSKEDSQTFEAFVALGTPKELKKKLEEHESLSDKVRSYERREEFNKMGALGINPDVLSDWAQSAADLEFVTKSAEEGSGDKKKVTVTPVVRVPVVENGKSRVVERDLLEYAQEVLPDWKYKALTATAAATEAPDTAPPVKLPDLRSSKNEPTQDRTKKRPVDRANEERASRPNPFKRPVVAVAGANSRTA